MMNSIKPHSIASILLVASMVASAATPTLVGTVQLSAPTTGGRASSDGKVFVVQLQRSRQYPAGLQVIDTSDPKQPRLMGFLELSQNGQMALAGDGKMALMDIQAEREQFNKEIGHELIAIDLSDPSKPRELWRRQVKGRNVVLAPGANAFAYSRGSANGRWETVVVSVKDTQSQIAIEESQYSDGNMAFSSNAKYLAYEWNGRLSMWDLTSRPPKLSKQEYSGYARYKYHCFPAVLDSGYAAMEDTRTLRIGIYQATSGVPRVSILPHDGAEHCKSLNPNAADNTFVYGDITGRLQQLDFHNPTHPVLKGVWQTPKDTYALATAQHMLFAGTGGVVSEVRLYRLDIEKPSATDWHALEIAHKTILDTYNAELKTRKPIPGATAVDQFQRAGIIQALDAPVEGISSQQAAAILNDYGFLAIKWAPPYVAEHALRRAIDLDPKRVVAHLNLADFLRQNNSRQGETGDNKSSRLKEIEKHYRTYLELGGKLTQSIDSFLKGDPTSQGKTNACEAIAAYANLGRLGELEPGNGFDIPAGRRRIDLIFTTEGTAHVPTYYAFDSANDFPLKDEDVPRGPADSEELWGGDNLALLTYRNEHYILHYRDLAHPVAARSLSDGGECQFEASTTERIGPSAIEPKLCALLQNKKGPPELKFKEGSAMTREQVSAKWGESDIGGTRMLDIANDGNPINVAVLGISSGAGPGCDEVFYETVDGKATRFISGPKRDLLMQLQGADPSNRYPILPCSNSPRFFSYKNQIYFETKPMKWPPSDAWNQYHRVTTINKGEVRDVCDFRFKTVITGHSKTANRASE